VTGLDAARADRIAEMALSAISREYPNKILHALTSDADVAPPRELTPAFFGAYDWHSAVHGHFALARLCRLFPRAPFVPRARALLGQNLSTERLAGELRYLERPDREGFEVPYGMGWLLALHGELGNWNDADASALRNGLGPLADLARARILRYLDRLPFPVRTGEHSQTAFGAALFLDWARGAGDSQGVARATARIVALYQGDRDGPLHLEPSGYDFLSPCLSEADLMGRVLDPETFSGWLERFLPGVPRTATSTWLETPTCPDRADGKLVHLDGLCASRAWMLEGIARALPSSDTRTPALLAAAQNHRLAALEGVETQHQHYVGSHWLGTFAVYLTTCSAP
jgi:hypothetical protein